MISSWNWISIIIWIIILIYLIFIIYNIHSRKKKFIQNASQQLSSHNFKITLTEIIILVIAIAGMVYATFGSGANSNNSTVSQNYKPLILDTNGKQSYYVQVRRTPSSQLRQYYSYLVKGERYRVLNNESVITDSHSNINVPYSMYSLNSKQLKELDSHYQKAWVGTLTTKYKDNWSNGIRNRAGKVAKTYTLIRVPDQSFVYVNNNHAK